MSIPPMEDPSARPSLPVQPVGPWTLQAIATGDTDAEDMVRAQAEEIARAMSAHAIATEPDARAFELEERFETLSRIIWPEEGLSSLGLKSTVGAYLIARVAVSWAPPSETEPLDEPLTKAQLGARLVELGAPRRAVEVLLANHDDEVMPEIIDSEILTVEELAGLASGGLTQTERSDLLWRVAKSPRCLVRLATVMKAIDSVRTIMPVLPKRSEHEDPRVITALAALVCGLPARAGELAGDGSDSSVLRLISELAQSQDALERGEAFNLGDDLMLPVIDTESREASAAEFEDEDDDDELDIVEERPSDDGFGSQRSGPRLPGFGRPDWEPPDVTVEHVDRFESSRLRRRSSFARLGSILGVPAKSSRAWVPDGVPLPPEPNAMLDSLASEERPIVAVVPTARCVLRAVLNAAEGQIPARFAVQAAGDAEWAVKRARAIALVANGAIDEALVEVAPFGGRSSPEGRWAEGKDLRYRGRRAGEVPVEELRGRAAELVRDLGFQFGRTLSGAV